MAYENPLPEPGDDCPTESAEYQAWFEQEILLSMQEYDEHPETGTPADEVFAQILEESRKEQLERVRDAA